MNEVSPSTDMFSDVPEAHSLQRVAQHLTEAASALRSLGTEDVRFLCTFSPFFCNECASKVRCSAVYDPLDRCCALLVHPSLTVVQYISASKQLLPFAYGLGIARRAPAIVAAVSLRKPRVVRRQCLNPVGPDSSSVQPGGSTWNATQGMAERQFDP
ncbi:hypothetical protein AVEN_101205-1 [Araneus ventricosus]|uniref:Uncharacterized protein n=1 Tax=Araneus ventricosus TaxID=182803 RepID=A0A4Y2K6F2_ARAVE|nr:hypothetical protein AVEN_101205-1 [Araneus ventricosus]